MPRFGASSEAKIRTCHADIQVVVRTAIIRGPDFTVIFGARTPVEQADLVSTGFSQKLDSLHVVGEDAGRELSDAIDIAPWPVVWPNRETQTEAEFEEAIKRFHVLGGYVLGVADQLNIALIWGGDWDRDWIYTDQRFHDLGHLQRM